MDQSAAQPSGVLVLGMHRSGTSVATRLVNLLGPALAIGTDRNPTTPWNPKGNFESRSLQRVNNELLARVGHTWWYPPPEGERYWEVTAVLGTLGPAARSAFDAVHPVRPWVWKDPRISLLIPFWRSVLPGAAAVIVYRHPLDVAASLARRNSFSTGLALALWERYNRLVLNHCQGMATAVVRYDDLVDDPARSLDELGRFLSAHGMDSDQPDPVTVAEFVEGDLRHSQAASSSTGLDEVPADAVAVLDALDACRGSTAAFTPPEIVAEPAWVADELERMGPRSRPVFNEP